MRKMISLAVVAAVIFCLPIQSFAMGVYTIRSGDTLWGIAVKNNVSYWKVVNANPEITNPRIIHSGQQIYIPASDSKVYTVKSGDTLHRISRKYSVNYWDLLQENPQISNYKKIQPGDKVFIPNQSKPKTKKKSQTKAKGVLSQYERKVIQLTNHERTSRGLPALKIDYALSKMAQVKANDMRDHHYFSHHSPTYGSPFDMMKSFGIQFSYAGENIAAGQPTPKAVMKAWMKSPGHRRNILSPHYTRIGVGYAKGGSYGSYWVQEFRKP